MDAIHQVMSVARRVAKRFPMWTVDEVVSELWIITVEAGVPPHACHLRLHDAYARSFGTMSRKTAARRRDRGEDVPQLVTSGDPIVVETYDDRRADQIADLVEDVERRIGGHPGYAYACLVARGLKLREIAVAEGRSVRSIAGRMSQARAMVA